MDRIYTSLLPPNHFRLLRIGTSRSHELGEELECRLTEHGMSSSPPYIALSYAWNEPQAVSPASETAERHIRLNDHRIKVTPNLYHALAHLASSVDGDQRHDGYIWIDALCINQGSDAERTSQVSMMHHIYHSASSVLVWLGPDPKGEVGVVREFLRALLAHYWIEETALRTGGWTQGFLGSRQALVAASLPGINRMIWQQIYRFWARSWFSRVWVLQEVALARGTSFWCGDIEFTQRELTTSSEFFKQSGLSSTLIALAFNTFDPVQQTLRTTASIFYGSDVGGNARRITALQATMRAEESAFVERWLDKRMANRLTGPVAALLSTADMSVNVHLLRRFLLELFSTWRDDCTDPRDRIFTVTILVKQMALANGLKSLPLETDYTKGVSTVFTQTTAWIINTTGWLGAWAWIVPYRTLGGLHPSLPSWVVDFRASNPRPLLFDVAKVDHWINMQYGRLTPETRPVCRGLELRVNVRRIGVVHDVGDRYEDFVAHGKLEETARLLLKVPEAIWPGYTRVDYWIDTIACQPDPQVPMDMARRLVLRTWLIIKLFDVFEHGSFEDRVPQIRAHLSQMPKFDSLARADATKTLPTIQDFDKDMPNRRPSSNVGYFDWHWRRVFRLVNLGLPHCPAATLLGLGPEAIVPGDEVFEVRGSAMPLVLRQSKVSVRDAPPRAQVVGEAFMTGFPLLAMRMDHIPCEVMDII